MIEAQWMAVWGPTVGPIAAVWVAWLTFMLVAAIVRRVSR